MFEQDSETFLVLHDCWLTILSHSFNFLTTQCTLLSSIGISTFFYCRCVMFAVGGNLVLRAQNITTLKLLSCWVTMALGERY